MNVQICAAFFLIFSSAVSAAVEKNPRIAVVEAYALLRIQDSSNKIQNRKMAYALLEEAFKNFQSVEAIDEISKGAVAEILAFAPIDYLKIPPHQYAVFALKHNRELDTARELKLHRVAADGFFDRSLWSEAESHYQQICAKPAHETFELDYAFLKLGWIQMNQKKPASAYKIWTNALTSGSNSELRRQLLRDSGKAWREAKGMVSLVPFPTAEEFQEFVKGVQSADQKLGKTDVATAWEALASEGSKWNLTGITEWTWVLEKNAIPLSPHSQKWKNKLCKLKTQEAFNTQDLSSNGNILAQVAQNCVTAQDLLENETDLHQLLKRIFKDQDPSQPYIRAFALEALQRPSWKKISDPLYIEEASRWKTTKSFSDFLPTILEKIKTLLQTQNIQLAETWLNAFTPLQNTAQVYSRPVKDLWVALWILKNDDANILRHIDIADQLQPKLLERLIEKTLSDEDSFDQLNNHPNHPWTKEIRSWKNYLKQNTNQLSSADPTLPKSFTEFRKDFSWVQRLSKLNAEFRLLKFQPSSGLQREIQNKMLALKKAFAEGQRRPWKSKTILAFAQNMSTETSGYLADALIQLTHSLVNSQNIESDAPLSEVQKSIENLSTVIRSWGISS